MEEFKLYLLKLKRTWLIFVERRKKAKEKKRESRELYKKCWEAAVRANLIGQDCICRLESSGCFKYLMDCDDCPYHEKRR